MKAFTNVNARDLAHAVSVIKQAKQENRIVAIGGGGSDLLGLMKERLVTPDVLVRLAGIKSLDGVKQTNAGATIGGQTTLAAVAANGLIREQFAVLAEAAESVATPQIRSVGTLAGNVCQRPWCWYYRNGFKCFKNGGTTCYSVSGENEFHAIFGGGPSYIVHPSDTAAALVALDAVFRIVGPSGERRVNAAEFFTLPTVDAARENVLTDGEILADVALPRRGGATIHSAYHKVLDREAWTHAVISVAIVMEMEKDVCRRARVVLGGVAPIPWQLPEVEKMVVGQRATRELATKAGEEAVRGARAMAKNAYKVPMVRALVARAIGDIADRGMRIAD